MARTDRLGGFTETWGEPMAGGFWVPFEGSSRWGLLVAQMWGCKKTKEESAIVCGFCLSRWKAKRACRGNDLPRTLAWGFSNVRVGHITLRSLSGNRANGPRRQEMQGKFLRPLISRAVSSLGIGRKGDRAERWAITQEGS